MWLANAITSYFCAAIWWYCLTLASFGFTSWLAAFWLVLWYQTTSGVHGGYSARGEGKDPALSCSTMASMKTTGGLMTNQNAASHEWNRGQPKLAQARQYHQMAAQKYDVIALANQVGWACYWSRNWQRHKKGTHYSNCFCLFDNKLGSSKIAMQNS